ncbi:hypothetical protein MASR2M74_26520 [Paracoccaceae bacterium]
MEPAQTPDETDTAKPVAIRAGTKQAQIIAMLQRPEGATVAEIVECRGMVYRTPLHWKEACKVSHPTYQAPIIDRSRTEGQLKFEKTEQLSRHR